MKKMSNSVRNGLVAAGVLVLTTSSQAIDFSTLSTVNYGDINAAALIGFGVALTVGLLMKAKSFFR